MKREQCRITGIFLKDWHIVISYFLTSLHSDFATGIAPVQ